MNFKIKRNKFKRICINQNKKKMKFNNKFKFLKIDY